MKTARLLPLSLVTLAFIGFIMIQARLTALKPVSWQQERMTYLPRTDIIKPLLLGFQSTYADFLWIRTTLYFGGHFLTDKQYPWLVQMIDMVTRLNPNYYPAYEFAGLILPELCSRPDAARVILERGIGVWGSRNWRLPFYLGWVYFQNYNDPAMAARYLELASRSDRVPPYIIGLTATLYKKANKVEDSMNFLKALYVVTQNPSVKTVIEEKLAGLSSTGQ